jgi:alkylation response protein AidB-like acyl-CoA dehydrogenase
MITGTPEHEAFRKVVRDLVEGEINPHVDEWEAAGIFPAHELFPKLAAIGALGLEYDPEYGGQEADHSFTLVLAEELGRADCAGVPMAIAVQTSMATPALARFGSEELKRAYLEPALRGEQVASIAVSEPDAGSDVAAIRTTARRDGDDLVVSGSKMWITNGTRADFLTMAVRTGGEGYGGISLLLFPTDVKGFGVSRKLEKVGLPSSDTAALFFEDCRVPARWILGELDQGFTHIMMNFQGERLVAAVQAVAGMQLMLEGALRYGEERRAFGRPVRSFQAWRHRLADHLTAVEAARWLTYRACDLFARRQVAVKEISMAKLFACELAQEVAYDCMQLHGGMGYVLESDIARAWRDVRVLTIAGGTSEIMRELVARAEGL